jgi:hypothetical protein
VINLGAATARHRREVTTFNVRGLAGHVLRPDRSAWDPARGAFALRTNGALRVLAAFDDVAEKPGPQIIRPAHQQNTSEVKS